MDLKQYRSKLIGSDDERAVSPVIGVILMVAITVILAAVIAAFVLDMGGNQSAPAQAGVSVDDGYSGNNTLTKTVTIQSIGDSTQEVYCSDHPSESGSNVGDEFGCVADSNIIAVNDEGSENIISET
ncbi:type IV pilin N-terminal domain-containing protein [Natrinema sp. DC36]|uniref:type IV pilin n=1 Tax=Natrinema sp. DC36 TaxID=2878680 RepID=UPI001CEFBE83|nr:type IV pilin N-terminal domain-containing protein [Natrinema sp. DC36]